MPRPTRHGAERADLRAAARPTAGCPSCPASGPPGSTRSRRGAPERAGDRRGDSRPRSMAERRRASSMAWTRAAIHAWPRATDEVSVALEPLGGFDPATRIGAGGGEGMANVQEDRPRLPYGARDKRSVGLLVLLFLAVFAAIFFIRNVASRHHEPAATAPVASTEVPTAAPPASRAGGRGRARRRSGRGRQSPRCRRGSNPTSRASSRTAVPR